MVSGLGFHVKFIRVKISNEFKIGLLAIVVIALSVWGYIFLRGRNILQASNTYYVRYENIDELASTSAVLIRGLKVGTVSSVKLDEDMKSIIATLTIDKGINIPAATEAVIVSTGLMGGKAVELRFDEACSGPDCATPGDFLKGRIKGVLDSFLDTGEDGTLEEIKTNVGELLRNVGDSLTSPGADNAIAKTFTDFSNLMQNLASITAKLDRSISAYDRNLQASLGNISTLTGTLASNQDKIAESITHLESIMRQFDEGKVGEQTSTLLAEATEAMKQLDVSLAEANVTFTQLSSITKDLDAGKGTLGKLLKDQGMYDNATRTFKNLDLLLQDFRLNPKRYVNVSVFGKKQRAYEVPEDDPAFEDQQK